MKFKPNACIAVTAILFLSIIGCACFQKNSAISDSKPRPKLLTPPEFQSIPAREPDQRIPYGDDPNNIGDLRVPMGNGPFPVVVLIHGGCWKEPYAVRTEMGPIGDMLKDEGIASWNIEYRRLYQPGSGWPGTYLDVGKAIDHLRTISSRYNLDMNRVVVLGHSAGGHLAMWSAARDRLPKDSELYIADAIPIRGVIDLAGTIDMRENIENMDAGCKDRVITGMMGGSPSDVPQRYAQVSSVTMVPLGKPQVLIWDEYEDFLPRSFAEEYVKAASEAGDRIRLIVVPGVGHFELASPHAASWNTVHAAILALLDGNLPK